MSNSKGELEAIMGVAGTIIVFDYKRPMIALRRSISPLDYS